MESVNWLIIGPINQVSCKISLFIGCIFVPIVLFLSFAILSSPERFDQNEYISEHSWLLSNYSPYQTNLDKFDQSIWKQRLFDKMVVVLSSYRVTTFTCRYVPVWIILYISRWNCMNLMLLIRKLLNRKEAKEFFVNMFIEIFFRIYF